MNINLWLSAKLVVILVLSKSCLVQVQSHRVLKIFATSWSFCMALSLSVDRLGTLALLYCCALYNFSFLNFVCGNLE